jgi:hypothetical protein
MHSRPRSFRRCFPRKLCSLFVLAGICASTLPLPVPPSTGKDRSEQFPCQNRPCGCRSAQQCWKKCCCFTNAEKLAWAKANRVTAPKFVHVAAANDAEMAATRPSCCSRESKASCCQLSSGEFRTESTQSSTPVENATGPQKTDYVMGVFAEQCRGESSFWNALPWVIIPDPLDLSLVWTSIPLFQSMVSLCPAIPDSPPVPPPRRRNGDDFLI